MTPAVVASRLRDVAGPHRPNLLTEAADLIEELAAKLQEPAASSVDSTTDGLAAGVTRANPGALPCLR